MPADWPDEIEIRVERCGRCAGRHEELKCRRLTLGDPVHTHWAMCPDKQEPIMFDMRQNNVGPSKFVVEWLDAGGPPRIRPDDDFDREDGTIVGLAPADPELPFCDVELPYPAAGVGIWKTTCSECGKRASCMTRGDEYDPAALRVRCNGAGSAT